VSLTATTAKIDLGSQIPKRGAVALPLSNWRNDCWTVLIEKLYNCTQLYPRPRFLLHFSHFFPFFSLLFARFGEATSREKTITDRRWLIEPSHILGRKIYPVLTHRREYRGRNLPARARARVRLSDINSSL
jgi:hypothetical protein